MTFGLCLEVRLWVIAQKWKWLLLQSVAIQQLNAQSNWHRSTASISVRVSWQHLRTIRSNKFTVSRRWVEYGTAWLYELKYYPILPMTWIGLHSPDILSTWVMLYRNQNLNYDLCWFSRSFRIRVKFRTTAKYRRIGLDFGRKVSNTGRIVSEISSTRTLRQTSRRMQFTGRRRMYVTYSFQSPSYLVMPKIVCITNFLMFTYIIKMI